MTTTFVEIVEEVKQLTIEEKLELKHLLDNYLVDERRDEILKNYQESRMENEEGRLPFSSNLNELEAMLND